MTFKVEDGTGFTDSTSFATVAFADAYVSFYIAPTDAAAWAELTEPAKQRHLMIGTMSLGNKYRRRWKGRRVKEEQALPFPRDGVFDEDDFLIDNDVIPLRLQQATVEAAVRSMLLTNLEPDVLPEGFGIESISQKFDVFAQSIKYAGAKATQPVITRIENLLIGLITGGMGQYPVDRG